MSIPFALSSPPRHWPQSDSSFSTTPKPSAIIFQLALGIFVGLVQRFVGYHLGFDRLRSGLLSPNGVILALDGVFGVFGGIQLGLDSPPPLQPVVGSGPSLVEAQLDTEDSNLPLEYIESDGYPHDATYLYTSLGCVIVAFAAGAWVVQRRAARLRNASATPLTGSGENGTKALHNIGIAKLPAPKWKQISNRGGSEGNHDENPNGDDVSEDDDDDDDDDPPPPGSGSEFHNMEDDEGLGNFWKIVTGNFLLGSIVMSVWKFLRESRWARNRNGEHGPEARSFGETIGMETYDSEWDVLTGNYRLPSAPWPSMATTSTFLTLPALSLGSSSLARSANGSAVATHSEAGKNTRQANVGSVPKRRKAATRYMWAAVSKLKLRLGNLAHELVEAFGLMTFAMLFVFPLVVAYLGFVRGGGDFEEEVAQGAESVGASREEAKGAGDDGAEGKTEVVSERSRLGCEALLETLECRKQEEDGGERFVYLNERLYAPCARPLHDIPEIIEPMDSSSSNLEDQTRTMTEEDNDTEMLATLLQMVFPYHESDGEDGLEADIQTILESQDETRKADDEDDLSSDVDSYVTAEENEVDVPMDVDDVEELVREKLEPCLEQSVLGVSGRLHESIWEVGDDGAIVDNGLTQSGLPKPQVAFPLWSTSNLWAYNPPSTISSERVLPSDAFALALSTSSNAESTTRGIYMTPPQVDIQVFPGSPPAVPRGRKLRLREKLMREWETRARESLFYDD